MNYKRAAELVVASRKATLAKAGIAYSQAMNKHTAIYDAEIEYKKAIITGGDVDEMKAKRNQLITSLGYDLNDFFPESNCTKCGDSGYIGGRVCSCAIKYATLHTAGASIPAHTFADCNLELFSGDAKLDCEKSHKTMRMFCEKFPNTKNRNILIMGGCGTGKTFLACAVANELMERCHSVLFLSAFKFNDICLKYHTSFTSDRTDYLNALFDCELLIIDDLGSESILNKVTVEYLYLVADERMRNNKHTLITTNLDRDGLEQRYSTRTTSRLFADNVCLPIALVGNDLRSKR